MKHLTEDLFFSSSLLFFCHQVVENSSPVSHLNIPQLVGMAEGKVLVQTFDWQQHLTHHFRRLPQIKSYQHFRYLY